METFKDFDELTEKYYTMDDLKRFLDFNNYSVTTATIKRWETMKIIPETKRVIFQGTRWRVYTKDQSDFKLILNALEKKVKKRIYTVK
jgi:DNA-binding transcriptional MerR regulator